MTVRVVSDGPIKTKRVTCPNCGYELEFTGEDVSYGEDSSYIYCPRLSCMRYGARTSIGVKWP